MRREDGEYLPKLHNDRAHCHHLKHFKKKKYCWQNTLSVICIAHDETACTPIAYLVERDEHTQNGKSYIPRKLANGHDCKWDGQEVCHHWEGDNHKDDKDKDSQSGANKEEGHDVNTTLLGDCEPAVESPHLTIKELLFRQMVVEKLVEVPGIYSPSLTTTWKLSKQEDVWQGGIQSPYWQQEPKAWCIIFKMMKHCFKPYDIHVTSRIRLEYQHHGSWNRNDWWPWGVQSR